MRFVTWLRRTWSPILHIARYWRQDVFSEFFRIFSRPRNRLCVKEKRKGGDLLDYWQRAVGQYVRTKRLASHKAQKGLSKSRTAINEIENGRVNFTLETLLDVLRDVDGNISEAFQSRIPTKYESPERQELHELEELLAGNDKWATAARVNIQSLYESRLREKERE